VVAEDNTASVSCFTRERNLFAGKRFGDFADDMFVLEKTVLVNTRMWGFQVCSDEATGAITSFRIKIAHNYGTSEVIDM